jgi:hypothetical protein
MVHNQEAKEEAMEPTCPVCGEENWMNVKSKVICRHCGCSIHAVAAPRLQHQTMVGSVTRARATRWIPTCSCGWKLVRPDAERLTRAAALAACADHVQEADNA